MDAAATRFVSSIVTILLLTSGVFAQNDPPSAELAVILAKWRAAVSEPERYEIRGQRIVYNEVFNTEKIADIVIQYEAPQTIRLEVQPIEVPKGMKSKRKGPTTGRPYKLESDQPHLILRNAREAIHCVPGTGRLLLSHDIPDEPPRPKLAQIVLKLPPPPATPVDLLRWSQELIVQVGEFYCDAAMKWLSESAQTFAERIQRSFLLAVIPESSLPSLYLIDAPGFHQQVDWTISKWTNQSIWLHCRPVPSDRNLYFEFTVILDPRTGRPKAQRIIDPSGNMETMIIFNGWSMHPTSLRFDFDRKQWDYEIFPVPPEFTLLEHRRK